MNEDDLAEIEKGLHSPAMQCGHCTLVRRLVAQAREDDYPISYDSMVTPPYARSAR